MDIERFADNNLHTILAKSQLFKQLDGRIKKTLPPMLRDAFRVVNLIDGQLIIFSESAMVTAKLKLLAPSILSQLQQPEIQTLVIQTKPKSPQPTAEKAFELPQSALSAFERTAQRVQHHPELANAINGLVARHRK